MAESGQTSAPTYRCREIDEHEVARLRMSWNTRLKKRALNDGASPGPPASMKNGSGRWFGSIADSTMIDRSNVCYRSFLCIAILFPGTDFVRAALRFAGRAFDLAGRWRERNLRSLQCGGEYHF